MTVKCLSANMATAQFALRNCAPMKATSTPTIVVNALASRNCKKVVPRSNQQPVCCFFVVMKLS